MARAPSAGIVRTGGLPTAHYFERRTGDVAGQEQPSVPVLHMLLALRCASYVAHRDFDL
jgi:hypothetical protein